MNDASKRLRETSADKPVKTYATSSELGTMAVPMPSTGYGVKIPKLPPGVGSLEAWGRTKISFGKFKGKRTYSGLTSPFAECRRSQLQVLVGSSPREGIAPTVRFGELFVGDG